MRQAAMTCEVRGKGGIKRTDKVKYVQVILHTMQVIPHTMECDTISWMVELVSSSWGVTIQP